MFPLGIASGRPLSSDDSQWLLGLPSAGPARPWSWPVTCVSPLQLHFILVFLPCPSPVWFSRSVQHQGRLSLDLSHRACSDYSEMRASHGSNSLPSSARLGNCTTRTFSLVQPFLHLCILMPRPPGGLPTWSPALPGLRSAPHYMQSSFLWPSSVSLQLSLVARWLFAMAPWPRRPVSCP